jgi:hypothetical protein
LKPQLNLFIWLYKNSLSILGSAIGALLGFTYWYFIGCPSGLCKLTSNLIYMCVYGSIMGGLFFYILQYIQTHQTNERKQ